MSRRYLVRTFGCQMNEHDSERIAGLMEADGYEPAADLDDADVVVLNTCCIRENADNKLYGGRRGESSLSEIPIPASEAGAWRVEEEFINAIRGLEPITHTSFTDGLKYMIFTEAVTRSMVEGKKISLLTL